MTTDLVTVSVHLSITASRNILRGLGWNVTDRLGSQMGVIISPDGERFWNLNDAVATALEILADQGYQS